jgi:phosphoribosyl-AMP cyclohydrolase
MIDLPFEKNNGLLPAVAQDADSGEVLMLAWINREAWDLTLKTGIAHYWSRSRKAIWKKGESSGNTQDIVGVYVDCDADTVLYKVRQNGGAACHEGYTSCFFRKVIGDGLEIVGTKVKDPEEMYGTGK